MHMLNRGYVYMGVNVSWFESRYLESHLAYNNGGGYNYFGVLENVMFEHHAC